MARMPSVIASVLIALVLGIMPMLAGCKTSRASSNSGNSGHCPSCRGQMGDEVGADKAQTDQVNELDQKR